MQNIKQKKSSVSQPRVKENKVRDRTVGKKKIYYLKKYELN
jgi:hypothetical protein